MGFFGGDNDNANDLLDQQLRQNQAELEEKKQSLYKTRLDIIKGAGAQQWNPDQPTAKPESRPKSKLPFPSIKS